MRIAEPARKHDIADEDILHAVSLVIAFASNDDEDITMIVGPSRTGALLEVGVLGFDTDDAVAIHAMPCRPKFLPRR